jgi:DNA-binding protein H-NS
MKAHHFSEKSVEELWTLHEQLVSVLAIKMKEEKAILERRLRELHIEAPDASMKRAYPPVHPKYRNPAEPSKTWAGRGKKPRWIADALETGRCLEDFRI